jgi:heme/copper-type cytochrome/quinol oxidase subunit 4
MSDEELEFDRRKKRAAVVFVLAVIFMLVVGAILVLSLLQHRPV